MDPTSSTSDGQPPVAPPQQTPPPAPARGSRNKWMVLAAVVLGLVLLAGILAVVFKHKGSNSNGSSKDSSLYYDRPGFDRAKLSKNIGDPMAIKITPSNKAQELQGGAVVIPACSLLTQDNITAAGLKLYVNDFGYPFIQNYLDDSGKAAFAADPNHMPSGEDAMGCTYGVAGGDTISIEVNQPFTATEGAVASDIGLLSYVKQPDVNGFQIYTRSSPEVQTSQTLLRKNGATIEIAIPDANKDKSDTLVKTVMSNFDDLAKHPKGASIVSYDTPTFTQPFVKSCNLVDNDDMKNLTGVDASPLVQAMWPTATGVADYSAVSNYKTKTNYLRNQCIRTSNAPGERTLVGIEKHTLRVTATTYENSQAASEGFKHVTLGDGNDSVQKGTGLGDESAIYRTNDDDKQMAIGFRQGRVVVQLVYDFAFQTDDAQTYVKKLSPVSDKIAAKLVEFNKTGH